MPRNDIIDGFCYPKWIVIPGIRGMIRIPDWAPGLGRFGRTLAVSLLASLASLAPAAQAQGLDLETLTCAEVTRIQPEAIQTTVIGLAVGYAMGQADAAFDLEEANRWFAAFQDLCKVAPASKVTTVLPNLAEQVRSN